MAACLPPTSNHRLPDHDEERKHHSQHMNHERHNLMKDMLHSRLSAPSRSHTPSSHLKVRTSLYSGSQSGQHNEQPEHVEDDPTVAKFKKIYEENEAKLVALFDNLGQVVAQARSLPALTVVDTAVTEPSQHTQKTALTSKKRKLDDDYDDYNDDDDDDDDEEGILSPLKSKTQNASATPNAKVQLLSHPRNGSPVPRPVPTPKTSSTDLKGKASERPEDARKALEEIKQKEDKMVRDMNRNFFFTLENDQDAMLDQQRLDEAERRAEAEAEGHTKQQVAAGAQQIQGSLASANLGASSLTLKNLIARIDQCRHIVTASEAELRTLMSEVRKNRSKWASEDKVGQEELYEAAEKVLNELKAQTEHSAPFLVQVKKKDAPDYYNVIKAPMDLGTMTKKLKQLAYKSKQEFVDDLHLTWTNCLKYNSALEHPMRKHALFMRKETDKLVPLIPEVVIRDRAEVEAEERKHRIEHGLDEDGEDSDDEPIMASRGRKAPSKKGNKAPNAAHKRGVVNSIEQTPGIELKVERQESLLPNGVTSEVDALSQGQSTPPPGTLTPTAPLRDGMSLIGDAHSEVPESEIPSIQTEAQEVPEAEDEDYKLWRQRTKKERAHIAAIRHKLFRGGKLNADEDALLRSKSGMLRWQRQQMNHSSAEVKQDVGKPTQAGLLADRFDNVDEEQESMLPDYYNSIAALPTIPRCLVWETDPQGQLIDQNEAYLHLFPTGQFVAPKSEFTGKLYANLNQMQETRKVVSKIGIVKQMQLQAQVYSNQFTKFEPAPFLEEDIRDHVMSDAGPLMAPYVSKAALTRSVAETCFAAGFEEYQPCAMSALTDIAADFFTKLCNTLSAYLQEDKTPTTPSQAVPSNLPSTLKSQLENTAHIMKAQLRPSILPEEAILQTLSLAGTPLAALHDYVTEDMARSTARLETMHARMRAHYADLLRPALDDNTAAGTGSGFADGGEQYVGGDFADELGEDFFGFKELGLDREFGLVNLSVPLHLLQSRLANAAQQSSGQNAQGANEKLFIPPPAYPRVNVENVEQEIGLIQAWLKGKLKENGDKPLPEDNDLPVKQRKGYGRPRIPATGKIGDGKLGVTGINASPSKKVAQKGPLPVKIGAGNNATTMNGLKLKAKPLQATNQETKKLDNIDDSVDAYNDVMDSPLPNGSQNTYGDVNGTSIHDFSPEKSDPSAPLKTASKPKLIRRKSSTYDKTGNSEFDAIMNGDGTDPEDDDEDAEGEEDADFSMVNGMDSPPASTHGHEYERSGKKSGVKLKTNGQSKGDDGEGSMISPESL